MLWSGMLILIMVSVDNDVVLWSGMLILIMVSVDNDVDVMVWYAYINYGVC